MRKSRLTITLSGTMLSAMTFNIRNGDARDGEHAWLNRHELVAQIIEQENPDVLGLQEVLDYQLDFLLDLLPQYTTAGVGREDGQREGEFSPILYKREFVAQREGTFWLSDTPEVPGSMAWGTACTRICTWLDLVTTEGRLFVLNCHLDHVSAEARARGLQLVAAQCEETKPTLLMGDFNCSESELAGYDVMPSWLVDTFRMVHAQTSEVNTYHGFNAGATVGDKIDYILAGPAWAFRVTDARIVRTTFGGRPPSDHFPVMASFELQST
jgi:endonuclease/exonuclease/phosphatase family metal-dependent hydrolase